MRHEDWVGQPTFEDVAPSECHREAVASLIRARAIRRDVLPAEWFADIAWDLMLALYAAHLDGVPLSHEALRHEPRATSRLRWLDVIIAEGVALPDQTGVWLSPSGLTAMRAYFAASASA